MEILIISGLSGAGKTRAADVLEDLDYYCVDNMPVALLPRFAELCVATRGRYERVALVTDVRERDGFGELFSALDNLWEMECEYKILFIEADTETIVKRYKETRRPHPLTADGGSIEQAVRKELAMLAPIRERADYVIDTSGLTIAMLQSEIYRLFCEDGEQSMTVNVMSFGFKYGVPIEADLMFDVRFMPNPYYIAHLRGQCGLDEEVAEYIFAQSESMEFLNKLKDMVSFLLPMYVKEGKHSLTIAIGCTGGRHRSVAVAKAICEHISELGYKTVDVNRDMDRA